ncbi:hypothetical protein N7478_010833 [Penicillium angulare]|uniref:uncharacterized protein n=1 Tax=Penicillium angulare TaxID=116970 RepID=UPI0025412172|nr:uncharacterized protein N7478_010833 [Penicillium angulare]KAJ5263228.1 hypothetical protein N7478_010833 [Penicillium angulare]
MNTEEMDIFPGMIDVWGQLPRMKGYTHLAACFPRPATTPRKTIIAHLEGATSQITTALPWLGGAVVIINKWDSKSTGDFTVARSPHTTNILKVQDRSEICPSFGDISKSKASSDQLLGSWLSNESAMPDTYTESETNPAPVLTLTVSWIKGGLILDCAAQHNILDMGGIDQIFQLLATALEGKHLGQEAISVNTRDRANIFPLLSPKEKLHDHSAMRCPSSSTPALRKPQSNTKPRSAFHCFRFNASSLSHLATLAKTPSTDDALSAFIWKRLSAIRQKGQNPDTLTGFSRAIDCRKTLDIPKEYMGVVVVKTASKMSFQEIEEASLEEVAAQLRRDVRRIRQRRYLRSLATLIVGECDKSTFSFVSGFDPDAWINASSWAGTAVHRLEYGILGKPAFVRRPQSKPVQSLLYFLPSMDNGDIDVLLCLRDDEIQGLRDDVEWCRYAEYIG